MYFLLHSKTLDTTIVHMENSTDVMLPGMPRKSLSIMLF